MRLVRKLWLGVGAALLAALAVIGWFSHELARQNVETMLLEEGRAIHGALMAVRRTYQQQFIDSGLPLDQHTVGFLPAHTMTRIAQAFRDIDARGIHFNNVSDRARNPANLADDAEMAAIRHFRAHPKDKERLATFTGPDGRLYYHYATPIRTEAYCLKCHGRPEDAPPTIRARYDLAYGYRVGELRGILSVKIPAEETEARIIGLWLRHLAGHVAVVVLALLLAGGLTHLLVVRRLSRFSDGARRLAAGDYAWRAPVDGNDEAAELARSLNDMAAAIQHSQEHMRLAASVFLHAREAILITDADERILDVNPAFTRITGYRRDEALGQTPRMLASGRQSPAFYAAMWQTLHADGHWSGEVCNRRKNGEEYPEHLSIATVRDDAGRITHYIGVFSDVTLVQRQAAQLEHLAHHDALTGVPNRVLLADRMRQAIAQANRAGELLAVCYLDLDGFKPVNDALGHAFGDRLLVEMARRMSETLREADTVARLGGDEFALLLRGLNSQEECEATLNRVLAAIARPAHLDEHIVHLTASIGVCIYPWDDEDADTLLRHADQAMYAAKQAGRGTYTFHDVEGDRRARSHRQTREDVRAALERDQFELYYQPQVDMLAGRVVGAEALIRWRHPRDGLLSPARFLPVIENTELDIALGQWVLEHAVTQAHAWHRQGLALTVSVNISALHLQRADFAQQLESLLARHPDLPPGRIELEILETAALKDLARVSALIRACARIGSEFALDDFGTGYSSLTYLKHLPVQTLKIDQSFVRDMLRDPEDLAIVEGVIALAEAFGRDVIAEGVDSLEAGLLLLQLGCAVAQGYSIARPMPADELPAWIAAWRTPRAWSEENFKLWRREDFALLLAEYHHHDWIEQLTARVEGEGEPADIALDPHACRFGRWYHGSGTVRYGTLPEFLAIDTPHQEVHALGAHVLALLRDGRIDEARARLPELLGARDALLDKLHALQERILAEGASR